MFTNIEFYNFYKFILAQQVRASKLTIGVNRGLQSENLLACLANVYYVHEILVFHFHSKANYRTDKKSTITITKNRKRLTDNIVPFTEGFDYSLVSVRTKSLYNNL